MDGWMFYILFNIISVMIGLRKADYERLGAIKCCLGLQHVIQRWECKPLGHAVASLTKGPSLLTVILRREDLADLRLLSCSL